MKKVLIIDDHGCRYCPCVSTGPDGVDGCKRMRKLFSDGLRIQINNPKTATDVRPIWCPLKDLPKHKMDWSGNEFSYESGWNDVLDIIGGDE